MGIHGGFKFRRYFIPLSALLLVFPLVKHSRSDHIVGEHKLEEMPIWGLCCHERDCVPQQVRIEAEEPGDMISAKIEGVRASIAKDKFFPVPSVHTWVCYYNVNDKISNDNIRCILYPQQSGTTRAPEAESVPFKG